MLKLEKIKKNIINVSFYCFNTPTVIKENLLTKLSGKYVLVKKTDKISKAIPQVK